MDINIYPYMGFCRTGKSVTLSFEIILPFQGRVGCEDQGNGQAPTLREDRQGLQVLGQPDVPLQDPLPAL